MATISSVTINDTNLNNIPTVTRGSNNFTISGTGLPTGLQAGAVTWSFGQGSATTNSPLSQNTTTTISGSFNYTAPGPSDDDAIVSSTLSVTVAGGGGSTSYPGGSNTKPVKVPGGHL